MNKQVVFHGGCLGCTQQEINGVDFCYDCRYFDADWSKPNLSNEPKSRADIVREEVRERVEAARDKDADFLVC